MSTHYLHIETAFSFRTRILDYLWASLPIVATDGDTFGTIIREHQLGRVVPAEDLDALVVALEEMLFDEPARQVVRANIATFAQSYRWSRTLEPLVEFCRNPRRAPDLAVAHVAASPTSTGGSRRPRQSIRKDIALARSYLKAGGVREVARRIVGRLGRVLGRKA